MFFKRNGEHGIRSSDLSASSSGRGPWHLNIFGLICCCCNFPTHSVVNFTFFLMNPSELTKTPLICSLRGWS